MILTNCAACAVPLPHPAKQCSRCKTRYCGPACQEQHWKAGTHDQLCRKIKKGGGAEQYHANKKCKEAVAVAVEACRGRHEGQKCYICLEAVHPRTGEGLVRGCACGDRDGVSSPELGVAHVSCLADQAKILVAEAEDNNLDGKVQNERFNRWHTCGLCEQRHHGVVSCALGWACWKTYLGRPENDWRRMNAMTVLGNGLHDGNDPEGALPVREATLSTYRRLGVSAEASLIVQGNLAGTYQALGRLEEALRIRRDVYSARLRLDGEEDGETIREANNYAMSLMDLQRYQGGKSLLRRQIPVARRVLGDGSEITLSMRWMYATALINTGGATLDNLREGVTTLEEIEGIARRVLGSTHPTAVALGVSLEQSRAVLAARETPRGVGVEDDDDDEDGWETVSSEEAPTEVISS